MSFVAISSVKYPQRLKDEIHSFGMSMIPLAKLQPGFISISFHQSTENDETMMYWEWGSQTDHEACMKSSDWSALMTKSRELFQSEGVDFSISTYNRLA
ncbi:MAG: antibiotic biosynthesis monooxygenase [Rhodospirillaceae bacterium]